MEIWGSIAGLSRSQFLFLEPVVTLGFEFEGKFATAAHDFRYDLATLGAGWKVYDVYATSMAIQTSIIPSTNASYAAQRRASAVKIGELELTSPMIVSAFGDEGVFFKHQRVEDK